ncbi:hypothetical protein [Rubinisphaera italica]|uniref:hypothetical protein n=1 Tax=Rubinisphaera italica TaxID=2527969 RepID=UPI0011B5E185|nr:hypothetical protein [Rubinisphaera italica]
MINRENPDFDCLPTNANLPAAAKQPHQEADTSSEPTEGEGTEGEECDCACGDGLSPTLTAIHTYEIWDDGGTPEFPDDDVLIGYAVTEFYGEPWGNTTIYDMDGNEVEPDENGEYPPQYNAQNSDWRLINAENFGTIGGAQAIGNALSKEQKKPDYQISQVASAVTTFAGTVAQVLLTGTVPLAEAGIKYNKIKEEKVGIAEIIIVHRLDTDVYIVTKKKNGSIVSSRVIRDRTLAEVEAMTAADMLQIASTGVADGLEKTGGAAVYAVMLFLPFDEGYFVFKGVQYLYKGGKLLKKVGDKYIELAGDELKRSVKAIKENVEKIKNCLKPIASNIMNGNPQLGKLIRDVDGMAVSASEKVRLLTEGAGKIDGITFTRLTDATGAKGIFKGSPIGSGPMKGRSPVLAVLEDGRIVRGFDKPHPFGKPYYVIDLKDLR